MQRTYIGKHQGLKIQALTDAMGSQVLVTGTDDKGAPVHLLSQPLGTHLDAENLGFKVLFDGPTAYSDWC